MRLLGQALTRAADAWEDRADPAAAEAKEHYRKAASDQYARDGEIEIDAGAVVSQGDDPGAYVAAWVWVYDETEEVGEETNSQDDHLDLRDMIR